MAVQAHEAGRPHWTARRRLSAALWRRPWLRATSLLVPPLGWMVVFYLAALAVLFVSAFLPTIADVNWEVRAIGDFDGDRKADLVWRNTATGENLEWLMDGLSVQVATFLTSVGDLSWTIAPRR